MRKIQTEDIVKKKYSLKNGQVVKSDNGEFFSNQIAVQVLAYREKNNLDSIDKLQKFDDEQRNSVAQKICIDRYLEIKSQTITKFEFNEAPTKKYEIYKLCTNTEKNMLADTKYFSDSKEKEVYYDRNIALEIYEIMSELDENVVNSFPELLELYQEEINQKKNRIEELKKEDDIKYREAINIYRVVSESEIFQSMKHNWIEIKNENMRLKEQLEKSNNIIKDLAKKLQVALIKYEKVQGKKISLWDRIRATFSRKKRLSSGKNG